jgi:MoaA/NifB/PqqE/SkfB family radical SAM enzyme
MPLDLLGRVLGETEDLGVHYVLVVGGEPLVIPGLIETLTRHRKTLFYLYTNATLLDREHVAGIARAPNILPVVSVEGDECHTDGRRGAGVHAKVEAGMRLMRQAGVLFGFCAMVTRENLDCVTSREWLDKMWAAGAALGVLADHTPFPGEDSASLALAPEDFLRKEQRVAQRKREARPYIVNFPADEYRGGSCGAAGRDFVHISPEGHVEPCPMCRYAADKVGEKSLKESLASPFLSELRRQTAQWEHDGRSCMLMEHDAEVAATASRTGAAKTDRWEKGTRGVETRSVPGFRLRSRSG